MFRKRIIGNLKESTEEISKDRRTRDDFALLLSAICAIVIEVFFGLGDFREFTSSGGLFPFPVDMMMQGEVSLSFGRLIGIYFMRRKSSGWALRRFSPAVCSTAVNT